MKKKYGIIVPILLIIDFLSLINFVNGFNCNLISMNTNKKVYYMNKNIEINASWELNYNVDNEIVYTQIHILNDFGDIIWNSSKYNEIGFYEMNWTVSIGQLNINFNNYSSILYVKFFIFYFHIDTTNTMCTYLETIKVRAIKRSLSCQLSGYREIIKLGENLSLKAKFYGNSSEGILNLTNQTIRCMISSKDIIIYYYHYTTDSLGNIRLNISSLTHLELGKNCLIFLITNNRVFNDSKFVYNIFVKKNPVFIDIILFKQNLQKNENLEIKLHYYYYFNQSPENLANHSIHISIFNNKTLLYINNYETDNFGILIINIPQVYFNFHQIHQNFIINIYFNGNYLLENNSLTLNFKLDRELNTTVNNLVQVNVFSFISILVILLILFSYFIANNRRKSSKLLTDLIIRY